MVSRTRQDGERGGTAARRLFVDLLPTHGGQVVLGAESARHAKVLRLGIGDPLRLFDSRGAEADARIVAWDGTGLRCETAPSEERPHRGPRLVLIQAMVKGKTLETIVRAATELGVQAIHLALTRHAIVRPDELRAAARTERLERIAREAVRQSERAQVTEIVPPASLAVVAARAPLTAHRWVFWEGATRGLPATAERATGEGAAARESAEAASISPVADEEAWYVIGPEGGLVAEEVQDLAAIGYGVASLGATVLRVPTAAIVATGLMLDRLGGLAVGPRGGD